MLTLTNNWNPQSHSPNPSRFPRGYLSTSYGGMDTYVRVIKGAAAKHDDFFDDETIKAAFKNYINTIVARYSNNPTVFGWELANDPRCQSSLGSKCAIRCVFRSPLTWSFQTKL
jgi:mannan endo-1,4-beta-mannosidase